MGKSCFLITGGSGFIGSNFCELVSKKNKVINLDKLLYSSVADKFKDLKKINYNFIKSDISNENLIIKIFKNNDINFLVNFASESHVDRSIENPKYFIQKNINSTLKLLDALRRVKEQKKLSKKFKFIHVSTDEVYGSSFKSLNEEASLKPNSPYSSTKASIDLLIRSYGKTFNLPYIICRPCNNFGPYQFTEKLVPTIITKILRKKKIPIYGDGNNFREWIYVKDTCKAILNICYKSKNFEIYNIGSNVRLRNIDLCKLILNRFKVKDKKLNNYIKFVYDRPGHDRSYSINSKKINENIFQSISSKKDIVSKLYKTVDWYIENDKWLKDCFKKYKGERIG